MIYKLKVNIIGNKSFLREYELKSDMTLFDLHDYLCFDLGFAPDQVALFHVKDGHGKRVKKYGIFDFGHGAIDNVTLEKLSINNECQLDYLYNQNSTKILNLELITDGEEEITRTTYPRLILERGGNPSQFSDDYEEIMDVDL